jgi:pilus assembly protein Flp/PilA
MKMMINIMLLKLRDKRGATAIEYGLLAGLIAVMIIAGATLTGTSLSSMFNAIGGRIPTTIP